MPARNVTLAKIRAKPQRRLRPDRRAKEGDELIVRIEYVLHGAAAQADGRADICRVDVAELGHGLFTGGSGRPAESNILSQARAALQLTKQAARARVRK